MTTAYRIDINNKTIQSVEIDVRNGFEAVEEAIGSPKIDGIGHVAGTFFIAGANSDGDIEDINVSIEDVAAKITAFQVMANGRQRPGQRERHLDFVMAISDTIKLKIIEDAA